MTLIKTILPAVVLLLTFSVVGSAQRPKPPDCPVIQVFASANEVTSGDTITFQASMTGGDLDLSQVRYSWHIDGGKIRGGDKTTQVIVVETDSFKAPGKIMATLQVIGIQPCSPAASEQVVIKPKT
jgi:hypothetical protein